MGWDHNRYAGYGADADFIIEKDVEDYLMKNGARNKFKKALKAKREQTGDLAPSNELGSNNLCWNPNTILETP